MRAIMKNVSSQNSDTDTLPVSQCSLISMASFMSFYVSICFLSTFFGGSGIFKSSSYRRLLYLRKLYFVWSANGTEL